MPSRKKQDLKEVKPDPRRELQPPICRPFELTLVLYAEGSERLLDAAGLCIIDRRQPCRNSPRS
jgi:hypothetical protein